MKRYMRDGYIEKIMEVFEGGAINNFKEARGDLYDIIETLRTLPAGNKERASKDIDACASALENIINNLEDALDDLNHYSESILNH